MYRSCVFVSLFLFFCGLPTLLHANPANGDPRLEKLFSRFMAPCCWRENLLAHHSPKADELRADLVRRVAAGESDGQIKQAMIEQHSLRILSQPEGARLQWLSWTPRLVTAAGLALVLAILARALRPAPMPGPPAYLLPQGPEMEWD